MNKSQKIHLKRLKRKRKVARIKKHVLEQRLFSKKSPAERARVLYERRHAKDEIKKKKEVIKKELGYKK